MRATLIRVAGYAWVISWFVLPTTVGILTWSAENALITLWVTCLLPPFLFFFALFIGMVLAFIDLAARDSEHR